MVAFLKHPSINECVSQPAELEAVFIGETIGGFGQRFESNFRFSMTVALPNATMQPRCQSEIDASVASIVLADLLLPATAPCPIKQNHGQKFVWVGQSQFAVEEFGSVSK